MMMMKKMVMRMMVPWHASSSKNPSKIFFVVRLLCAPALFPALASHAICSTDVLLCLRLDSPCAAPCASSWCPEIDRQCRPSSFISGRARLMTFIGCAGWPDTSEDNVDDDDDHDALSSGSFSSWPAMDIGPFLLLAPRFSPAIGFGYDIIYVIILLRH